MDRASPTYENSADSNVLRAKRKGRVVFIGPSSLRPIRLLKANEDRQKNKSKAQQNSKKDLLFS